MATANEKLLQIDEVRLSLQRLSVFLDHDYSVRSVDPDDLPRLKTLECSVRNGPPPLASKLGEKFADFGKNVGKVEDEEVDDDDDDDDEEDDEEGWVIDERDENKCETKSEEVEDDENIETKFKIKEEVKEEQEEAGCEDETGNGKFLKQFSKCDKCRRSRTKVLVPNSILSVTFSKNDGITCDFCGNRMTNALPQTLPNVFEGRRGSKGGDLIRKLKQRGQIHPPTEKDLLDAMQNKSLRSKKNKSYVYCGECGKVVLKESLTKHMRDVHQKTNKRQCHICCKVLSGPFSLKEHISAVHNKVTKHQCPHCQQMFAHFSNMNRHIRLLHDKMVVTHKYVNCVVCNKVVQATSLKKHMETIHERRRDFVCSYCNKGFAQSYTLKEHVIAKHTHNFCHTCSFCQKSFAHKTNACRHVRTVHKDQIDGPDFEGNILKKYVNSNKTEGILEIDDKPEKEGEIKVKIEQPEEAS